MGVGSWSHACGPEIQWIGGLGSPLLPMGQMCQNWHISDNLVLGRSTRWVVFDKTYISFNGALYAGFRKLTSDSDDRSAQRGI